ASRDRQRQFVDADDVAVPFRHAVELNDRGDRNHLSRSSDFTREVRIHNETPARPSNTPADQYHGNCGPFCSATMKSRCGGGMSWPILSQAVSVSSSPRPRRLRFFV